MTEQVTVNADDLRALLLEAAHAKVALGHEDCEAPDYVDRLRAALPWEPDPEVVRRWATCERSFGAGEWQIRLHLRTLRDAGLDVTIRKNKLGVME
jgi:hypothetical protein